MTTQADHAVAFACDAGFVLPVAVALGTLAQHYQGRVAVVADHLTSDQRRNLLRAARPLEIEWLEPRSTRIDRLSARYLSASTYHRLLLPELLADCSRIVYLDGDILVRKPVDPLFEQDLEGHAMAAVRNLRAPWLCSPDGLHAWSEIGADPSSHYLNAGVLILDADRWREDALGTDVLELAARLDDRGLLPQMDQDALNARFASAWAELDYGWNQHPLVFEAQGFHHLLVDRVELERLRNDPGIVHFIGRSKPWHALCTHPYADAWRAAAREFVDPRWEPERRSLRERIAGRLRNAGQALAGR